MPLHMRLRYNGELLPYHIESTQKPGFALLAFNPAGIVQLHGMTEPVPLSHQTRQDIERLSAFFGKDAADVRLLLNVRNGKAVLNGFTLEETLSHSAAMHRLQALVPHEPPFKDEGLYHYGQPLLSDILMALPVRGRALGG